MMVPLTISASTTVPCLIGSEIEPLYRATHYMKLSLTIILWIAAKEKFAWYPFDGSGSVEPGTEFTMGKTGAGNAQIEHQVTLTKDWLITLVNTHLLMVRPSPDHKAVILLSRGICPDTAKLRCFVPQVQSGQLWFMTSSNWYNER